MLSSALPPPPARRAFHHERQSQLCQLLPWSQRSPGARLQKNIHYDLYQKKGGAGTVPGRGARTARTALTRCRVLPRLPAGVHRGQWHQLSWHAGHDGAWPALPALAGHHAPRPQVPLCHRCPGQCGATGKGWGQWGQRFNGEWGGDSVG